MRANNARVSPRLEAAPRLSQGGLASMKAIKSRAGVAVVLSISRFQRAGGIFNWSMWLLLMFLMLSQLLTLANNSTQSTRELGCHNASDCLVRTIISQWAEFRTISTTTSVISVAVSNGARLGLFTFQAISSRIVKCNYDFSAFISNVTIIALLLRWMMAMIALHRGYFKGITAWHYASIGAISNSYSFTVLPIAMLPRLKMIMAAFLSVGCAFEGSQAALSDAWFVMYPSIVNFVFVYASLLNSVAKLLRRRMSDWMITPTILLLSAIHFGRFSIAQLEWFDIHGRITSVVEPDEFDQLSVIDLFAPKNSRRMGGNSPYILTIKLVIVLVNLLPLAFSKCMSKKCKASKSPPPQCKAEKLLAIRVCNVGGYGISCLFNTNQVSTEPVISVNAYELTRLGYVVFGDRYLISWENWIVLTTVRQMRSFYSLWNHRIMAFKVKKTNGDVGVNAFQLSDHGRMLNVDDRDLNSIVWWKVDARPLI